MRGHLALVVAAAMPMAAHAERGFGDALEAGGYITGGMLGGGMVGGLAGIAICKSDGGCRLEELYVVVGGLAAGMGIGGWLGARAYDNANDYDGSGGMAVLGFLGAGVINAAFTRGADGDWNPGHAALSLGLMVVGTGTGYVFGGRERTSIRLDSAMLTPMGDDGYGVGLGGHF